MSKKRQHLTDAEKQYIKENCMNKADQAIADYLERDVRTVVSYRRKCGITKGRGGTIKKIEVKDEDGNVEETISPTPELTSIGKKEFFRLQLRSSEYYDVLKEQFTEREMRYYLEQWGELGSQFSDIIATEKRQIDEMIKAEIMGNRILKGIKDTEDDLEDMQTDLEKLKDAPGFDEDEEALEKYEMMVSYAQRLASVASAMTTDYQRTVDLRRRIIEDLNGRRRDRVNEIKQAGKTFLGLVEAIQLEEVRKVQGEHAALLKKARDEQMAKWRKQNQYPDGSKDCFILDDKSEIEDDKNYIITEHMEPDLLDNPQEIDKEQ